MNHLRSVIEFDKVVKEKNTIFGICLILAVICLLLAGSLFFSKKTIVLVPNSLSGKTTITSQSPSIEYVEAFSRDVINLMLNVTPDNTEYANQQILKITHPAFHGVLKQELEARKEDINKRKITTYFSGQNLVVNLEQDQVLVSGVLNTLLGKELVSKESKTYFLGYKYSGFGLQIVDFHEVDPKELGDE